MFDRYTVLFEVGEPVQTDVSTLDAEHFGDGCVVNEASTADARLAGHDEPRTCSGRSARCSVADDVLLGVVAPDLVVRTARHAWVPLQ